MNQISQAALINNRILTVLEAAAKPLSALDLYDRPEIRELAIDRNKVSMMLSDLRRSGRVTRVPCVVPGTNVRFAYEFKADANKPRANLTPKVKTDASTLKNVAKSKPQITVTEHKVTIELDTIRITVEV